MKLPYFPYRLSIDSINYTMVARPTTTVMADLFILRDVLINETYKDVLRLLPKRKIRVLDIGANIGSFTIWMDKKHGIQEAFCFEPEENSFQLLNLNLALNRCISVKSVPCAIGGQSRRVPLALKQSSPGGTSIYSDSNKNANASSISVVALEEWLTRVDGKFDLLKMDCESAEWEIIEKNSPEIFKRFPVVLAEIHYDPLHNRPPEAFRSLMENLGYEAGVSTILGRANRKSNRFFLPRLPVNTWDDPQLLRAKLEGGYDWLHWPQLLKKSIFHNTTVMQRASKVQA